MQHIYTGTAAPAFAPPGVGHHYVNTVLKKTYISVGTSSVADWLEMNTGGGGGVTFIKQVITLTLADIANQYVDLSALALPNSVTVSQSRVLFYEGVDYTLTSGAVTRVSFQGSIAVGQPEAFAAGDVITVSFAV